MQKGGALHASQGWCPGHYAESFIPLYSLLYSRETPARRIFFTALYLWGN